MATLSGPEWVNRYPTSNSVTDLIEPFRTSVQKFLAALAKAGAQVSIAATFRPPQRAYLMHFSFLVSKGTVAPADVPPMPGVDIDWVHRDAAGNPDLAASRDAAAAMAAGYQIVFAPALTSRHTQGRAIDMDISWDGTLKMISANGVDAPIITAPRTGGNKSLQKIGAGFGVVKLATDPPHWSDDGH